MDFREVGGGGEAKLHEEGVEEKEMDEEGGGGRQDLKMGREMKDYRGKTVD